MTNEEAIASLNKYISDNYRVVDSFRAYADPYNSVEHMAYLLMGSCVDAEKLARDMELLIEGAYARACKKWDKDIFLVVRVYPEMIPFSSPGLDRDGLKLYMRFAFCPANLLKDEVRNVA